MNGRWEELPDTEFMKTDNDVTVKTMNEGPPVILFPLHGCAPGGTQTEEQVTKRLKELREEVRRNWTSAGVRAVVALIEMRGAMLQRAAILPGAGPHDQGQAYGAQELLGMLQQVLVSEEASGPVEG